MRRKHVIAGAVTVAALAGGTAGAVAATDDRKAAEQTVLSDAAKSLGVTADELRSALANAEDARIDAQVEAGNLTQAQADEIKQRRQQEGTVLGLGRGDHGPGGHHGGPGGRFFLADAAKAIGISESTLITQLRDGKDLTAIAKANGKTLDDVKSAVKASAKTRLDADLEAGRITQAQHDEEIAELDEHVDRLGHFGGFGDHGPHGPGAPDDADDGPA
jgi:hypothetical protein